MATAAYFTKGRRIYRAFDGPKAPILARTCWTARAARRRAHKWNAIIERVRRARNGFER